MAGPLLSRPAPSATQTEGKEASFLPVCHLARPSSSSEPLEGAGGRHPLSTESPAGPGGLPLLTPCAGDTEGGGEGAASLAGSRHF